MLWHSACSTYALRRLTGGWWEVLVLDPDLPHPVALLREPCRPHPILHGYAQRRLVKIVRQAGAAVRRQRKGRRKCEM
jgi:hypothetical protein